MKKVILILLALVCFVGISNAQKKDMSLSVGAEFALPQGDFGDAFTMGYGASVTLEYPFSKQLIGVATAGYLMWAEDEDAWKAAFGPTVDVSSTSIPVLAGVKYYFDKKGGFYAIGQAGLYFNSSTIEVAGGKAEDSDSEFAVRAGAGYELELSKKMLLDISAMYIIISDANHIGARVGVKFPL